MPEVGALRSTGVTRLRTTTTPSDSRRDRHLTRRRGATLVTRRVSLVTTNHLCVRAVPTTPADRAGACVDCFPVSCCLPHIAGRVGIRIGLFEACSGFTRVTARTLAQTAQGGLCHGASTRPVARPRRPPATRSIDNSLGGTLPHWCFAPSGRTRGCRRIGSGEMFVLGECRRGGLYAAGDESDCTLSGVEGVTRTSTTGYGQA